MLVDVLLPLNFYQLFTYSTSETLEAGDVVRVSFKNKEIIGVVWVANTKVNNKNIKLKEVIEKISFPSLSKKNLYFIDQLANYNLINRGLILNLFLFYTARMNRRNI